MNVAAGALGIIGIILMSLAGLVIADFDLSRIVFVVAIVLVIVAALFELVERGYWK